MYNTVVKLLFVIYFIELSYHHDIDSGYNKFPKSSPTNIIMSTVKCRGCYNFKQNLQSSNKGQNKRCQI